MMEWTQEVRTGARQSPEVPPNTGLSGRAGQIPPTPQDSRDPPAPQAHSSRISSAEWERGHVVSISGFA